MSIKPTKKNKNPNSLTGLKKFNVIKWNSKPALLKVVFLGKMMLKIPIKIRVVIEAIFFYLKLKHDVFQGKIE